MVNDISISEGQITLYNYSFNIKSDMLNTVEQVPLIIESNQIMRKKYNSISIEKIAEIKDRQITTELGKVSTPKGERLQIWVPDTEEEIWLDALNLESISWQSRSTFNTLIKSWNNQDELDITVQPSTLTDEAEDREEHLVEIKNEYAIIKICIVRKSESDYIKIESKRLGYSIQLTATELGSLAGHDSTLFSEFLRTPFGPE